MRIVARGANESVNTVFTIHEHPLWIGRKGCHVELAEAELSIRHCSICVRGENLVVRDADSHMGTFLDGQQIEEAVIGEGVHLLRVGLRAGQRRADRGARRAGGADRDRERQCHRRGAGSASARPSARRSPRPSRALVLICVEGPLAGQEFEIPNGGLVVGREGHVRVPDEFLSRRHFEVARDEDGVVRVRDLGSRNGTFLNTLPARNTKIHAGDEIRAGVNRFKIEQRA